MSERQNSGTSREEAQRWHRALINGLEGAIRALEKKKCGDFFKSETTGPIGLLTSLWTRDRIVGAQLGVGDENRIVAATTVGMGDDAFIRINTDGPFISPNNTPIMRNGRLEETSVTKIWQDQFGAPGLTAGDVRAIILLHELAHATLSKTDFPSDAGNSEQNRENTKAIIDNCIK